MATAPAPVPVQTQASAVQSTASSLDHAMTSFLDAISTGADKVGGMITKAWDYAEIQLTEVVRQFLLWEFTSAVISALTALVIMVVTHQIYKSCNKAWRVEYERDNALRDEKLQVKDPGWVTLAISSPEKFIIAIIYLVTMAYSVASFIDSSKIAAKIAIAPRIYLIEYGYDKYKALKKQP